MPCANKQGQPSEFLEAGLAACCILAYWVSVALARGTKRPYIPEGQVQIDINFVDAI